MDQNIKRVNGLIKRIGKGDIKALDELYIEFGGLLFVMARKYLYDKSYAEDLVSDILLNLVKNAKNFRYGENGLNWLFKTIKNSAINKNKRDNFFAIDTIDNHINLCDVFAEEDLIDATALHIAIGNLNKSEQYIVTLKFWEGLTVREISKKINKSVSKTQRIIESIYKKISENL